jgi:hypothetical protein
MRTWVGGVVAFLILSALPLHAEFQSPFDSPQWQCPLEYKEPPANPYFLLEIDPLIVLAEESCASNRPDWLKHLNQLKALRDQWVKIHTQAKNPGTLREETKELSRQIVELAGFALLELSPVLESKNFCGVPLTDRLEGLVVQTVKTLYASDQHLREAVGIATEAVVLPDQIASVLKRTKELWDERKQLREGKLLDKSCEELARQKQACDMRQAGANASAIVGDSAKKWEPEVRKRILGFKKASQNALDGKNPWEKLKSVFRPSEEDPNVLQTYFDHVIPMLRMCGMMRVFPDKPADNRPVLDKLGKVVPMLAPKTASQFYEEHCKVFFCEDNKGFQKPDPNRPGQQSEEVCRFVQNYPELERGYLSGFVAAVSSAQKGKPPQSYCLPGQQVAGKRGGNAQPSAAVESGSGSGSVHRKR